MYFIESLIILQVTLKSITFVFHKLELYNYWMGHRLPLSWEIRWLLVSLLMSGFNIYFDKLFRLNILMGRRWGILPCSTANKRLQFLIAMYWQEWRRVQRVWLHSLSPWAFQPSQWHQTHLRLRYHRQGKLSLLHCFNFTALLSHVSHNSFFILSPYPYTFFCIDLVFFSLCLR